MGWFSRRGGWSKRINTAYRSGLEENIVAELDTAGVKYSYEKHYVDYTLPATKHHYIPDFVLGNGIIVEAKGVFDIADRKKHIAIKEQHPDLDIRFVFSNASHRLNKTSKTTYAMWCDKHGFKYANKLIPDSWLREKRNRKRMQETDIYLRELGGGKRKNAKS